MLLLLKQGDCAAAGVFSSPHTRADASAPVGLRHLDRALGGNANTHVVTAHACADALFAHDRDWRAYGTVKARLWAHDLATAVRGGARRYDAAAASARGIHVPDTTSGFAKDRGT